MTVIFEKMAWYFSLNLEDIFVLVTAVYFLNALITLIFLTPSWIDSNAQSRVNVQFQNSSSELVIP